MGYVVDCRLKAAEAAGDGIIEDVIEDLDGRFSHDADSEFRWMVYDKLIDELTCLQDRIDENQLPCKAAETAGKESE